MDEPTLDFEATWDETLRILRQEEGVAEKTMAFLTFSRLMAIVADTALIAAPSTWAKDLFEQRIANSLRRALSRAIGQEVRFAVTVDETLFEDDEPATPAPARPARSAPSPAPGPSAVHNDAVDNPVDNTPSNSRGEGTQLTPETSAPGPVGVSSASRREPVPSAPGGEGPAETFSPAPFSAPSPASAPRSFTTGPSASTLGAESSLNSKYTFETFVIGSSNRFACAAASAVAEAPAKAYNPLFIYGGSGLGKTHLLHAVGHYARSLYRGIEVRYVNSEEFTNDFINSIQSGQFGKAQEFHRRYRDIDVLLIDDIQFLQRAPETMEAFFHTFNTLHNAEKQIVITSDLPPKQLGGFEDRMRSRFEMGLMTDVQPPDLETRIAILRKKVEMEGQQEIPRDVLEYIASHITTNIRELEGALIRVQALHSLSRQPMDVSLAEDVLKDLLNHDGGGEITAPAIIAHTASYFGITPDQITGGARTRTLVSARQIAMYLCRELTDMPLIRIGEEFGGRDHTTVMHANKKISELMKERRAIYNQVTELTARIKSSSVETSS
jgi:chromosomal replication initiator protein